MPQKKRAGVNTVRRQFDYVFSASTQKKLSDLLDIDYSLIPDERDPAAARRSIEGAEVILSTWGAVPYTRDVLDSCPDLKLILYGAGSFKGCLSPALIESDIIVCTAVHMNARPVAEFTLGLILASLKNVFAHNESFRIRRREAWSKQEPYNGGYYHTRIGLLGYGTITRLLLDLLRAFEFEVLVADDFMTEEEAASQGAVKSGVDEIMASCDVVSIHHADVERNWNIINKDTLSLMKPGARLINTSRGRMINEDDLVAKLREGSITAFLDVTHPEPPESNHPFYDLPNCIMTPHVAGSLGREVHRMGDYCLRELCNWLHGRSLENRIDIRNLDNRA